MSEVFYRKWRPQSLAQVIGQEPVTQTLRQAVLLGRVAHAYMFCGPRGTGKTSTARILAKAANCLESQGGEPDNACQICQSINESRFLDLIEIDAASNRGIDDIRNLSDKIRFTPNQARYKVYIIDEVHMLTEPAFNALLKTLEEPPSHAILILATTEPHKVPLTIISRCQRFDFRRIPPDLIVEKLQELCRDEQVEATSEALMLIARSSSGSLRDAENLLEQMVVSYGSPVEEEGVRDLLGLGSDHMALELAGHIIARSVQDGLRAINEVAAQGSDLRQLQRGIVEFLRAVLLIKSGAPAPVGYPTDTSSRLRSLAESVSMEHLTGALKAFATADLRRDSSMPLPLELALVESGTETSTQPQPEEANTAAAPDGPRGYAVNRSEPTPVPVQAPTRPSVSRSASNDPVRQPSAPRNVPVPASASPTPTQDSEWDAVIRALRHTGKRFKLGALLRACSERDVTDGVMTLRFPFVSHVERMEEELGDPVTRRELQEVLARITGNTYSVSVSLAASAENGPQRGAARRSHLVRVAQAMGARVVDEKEAQRHDEQENDSPGPTASAEDGEASGGA